MVASDEESEHWSLLLTRIVLVEGPHLPVLRWDGHTTEIFLITKCLQQCTLCSGQGRRRPSPSYLKVSAANEQVDLVALSLLDGDQNVVDGVQTSVTAPFYRDLRRARYSITTIRLDKLTFILAALLTIITNHTMFIENLYHKNCAILLICANLSVCLIIEISQPRNLKSHNQLFLYFNSR